VCTPAEIVPAGKEFQVDAIIRLNNPTYDEQVFRDAGFTHLELYFADDTVPPDPIVTLRFLDIVEGPSAVALHCKAGLERTYSCFRAHRGTLA
jgi:cell division cycle 14